MRLAIVATILALSVAPALGDDLTDFDKAAALQIAYVLNGNSMVRWGMIDLTGKPAGKGDIEPYGPPAPPPKKKR